VVRSGAINLYRSDIEGSRTYSSYDYVGIPESVDHVIEPTETPTLPPTPTVTITAEPTVTETAAPAPTEAKFRVAPL